MGPKCGHQRRDSGAPDNRPTPSGGQGAASAAPTPLKTYLLLQGGSSSRAILGSLSLHTALHPAEPGSTDSARLQRKNSLHIDRRCADTQNAETM